MKTFVILLVIGLSVSSRLFSQHAPTLAPLNPDFVKFMEKLNSGKAPLPGTDEFGTGGMPPPIVFHFGENLNKNKLKPTNFPSVYDMRTTGLLTPVRGQTSNGCWAFATIGSVESQWLKLGLGTWDLSENNLKYCHGFDPSRSYYGNHFMSTAYFARRAGPLLETDDPNAASSLCPESKIPVAYITEARYLPNDMNTIKQAILDHGAIYTMMYINTSIAYYNPVDFTYYRGDSVDVNHAVDLVGWDDNKITAATNPGAWICKNSYGTGWGEDGYFYISYYDKSILDYNAYWPTLNDYKAEDHVYGYDELGNYNSIFYAGPVGYMLVKFVASDNQLLSKIGTYAMASNTNLEIDIFDNFDAVTRSLSGLLSHTEGITCPMPGYYTSDINVPLNIEQGNDFYVRIRYQTPGFNYPVPIEEAIPGYSDPVIESDVAWISADAGLTDPWFLIGNSTEFKWDPCVKVYAEPVISWTGAFSSDWNTPGNWSTNTIPVASEHIRIPNVPTLPLITQDPVSPAVCNHLTIEPGATLTIEAGKALTVNGNLTNNAGNTGLIIESDASLITMGNVIGTATVKRSVSGDRWHLISAPVSDAVSGTFSGKYLQKHTESTNAYTYITTVSEAIVPLKGYALWSYGDFTANFTGHLNTGLTSIALTRTSADLFNRGWNLAGNPYPSSIDWDAAAGWTKDNVNTTIYSLTDGQWATYISGAEDVAGEGTNGGSRFIAPGQGFFVSVADVGSATLAMDNRVRVHNAGIFFKNADAGSLIRLKVSGNGYTDEALVRFIPEATAEFDPKYDAAKLYGYNNASAQIYTLGSTPLTINSLPQGSAEVALGIRANTAGEYTLAATSISSIDEVTLEDTRTGVFTNLAVEPYTFIFKTGENENRFRLHFSNLPFTGLEEAESPAAVIYGYNHTVHVNLVDEVKADIFIYTVTGQLAASRVSARGMNSISLPGTGIYMVRVITADRTIVKKVLVY